MPLSVAILLAEVRRVLQDRAPGAFRYEDADLLASIDAAQNEMFRLRPDIFYNSAPVLPTISAELPVESRFWQFLAQYAAGHALMQNTDYALSQGAAGLMEAARSLLVRTVAVRGG